MKNISLQQNILSNISEDRIKTMIEALDIKQANFGNEIRFVYPNNTLALTTTGNECRLNCSHCNGYYLKNMTDIDDYKEKVKTRNITSFLISGGCSFDGDVPINKHLGTIKTLKKEGYKLNAHLGLMDEENIKEICNYIDKVSFDLVFDRDTIQDVYNIDKTKLDYINVYETILKYTEVAPHICIGLKGGKIKGEYEIIDYLSKNPPKQVTFIVLIPTKKTRFEYVKPPTIDSVCDLLCYARLNLKNTEINLGCMRPRGEYRSGLDELALMCGINKIVLPSRSAKKMAKEMNLRITETKECCIL